MKRNKQFPRTTAALVLVVVQHFIPAFARADIDCKKDCRVLWGPCIAGGGGCYGPGTCTRIGGGTCVYDGLCFKDTEGVTTKTCQWTGSWLDLCSKNPGSCLSQYVKCGRRTFYETPEPGSGQCDFSRCDGKDDNGEVIPPAGSLVKVKKYTGDQLCGSSECAAAPTYRIGPF